jgi:predicted lipid carrier protein YhbT
MSTTASAFFDQLSQRRHEPLLEKVRGVLRVDLSEAGQIESWFVAVDHGDVVVSRRGSEADATVGMERALFERIVSRETNAMAAVLRGEVAMEGDTDLVLLFQRLPPGGSFREEQRGADADNRA